MNEKRRTVESLSCMSDVDYAQVSNAEEDDEGQVDPRSRSYMREYDFEQHKCGIECVSREVSPCYIINHIRV